MNLLKKGIGIVGSTTIDKIIAKDHSFLKLGGVTTYAGITYRRHGIPAFIISNIAEQDLQVIHKLHAADILVFSAKSDVSTYFVNYTGAIYATRNSCSKPNRLESSKFRQLLTELTVCI